MDTLDLGPATATMRGLVLAVRDDQLAHGTPCTDTTVADLCDHIGGLALAFTAAARKEPLEHGAPRADGSQLEAGWRQRIIGQLDELATAWADPAAYDGVAQAGPVELPAPVAAQVALNEVVVHAWDLARGLDLTYDPDPAAVAVCLGFVRSFAPPADSPATDGALYGPPVDVGPDASSFEQLLGLTGRSPA